MFIYKYEKSNGGTLFLYANHREIIDRCAKEGWRFVSAIPTYQNGEVKVREFDLVFEKEIK